VTADTEWIEGYRDGLNAALVVVRTVAADSGTAGDAVELLIALTESHVLDTPHPHPAPKIVRTVKLLGYDVPVYDRPPPPPPGPKRYPEPPANT